MDSLNDKIALLGAEALTDKELLTILTDDETTAEALLTAAGGSSAKLSQFDLSRLRMIGGLGLRRARLLAAAIEYGRRAAISQAAEAHDVIRERKDIVRLFRPQLENLAHEEFWAVYLTASNRIIERQRISQGGVQSTTVDQRLIVKRALELLSTHLILIHNHPSGTTEPSPEDKILTDRIARAAALFDIRLLDHIILSREGDFSFREAGLIGGTQPER
ncbi:MAG: JAB domain-containing protein [Alistipes sp.]|nr:JAB domain-containing protein [Alistipes sp.]